MEIRLIAVKLTFVISGFLLTLWANGQSINKSYFGRWGKTNWKYEFKDSNVYTKKINGYYGDTLIEGQYQLKTDTIMLLSKRLFDNPECFLIRGNVIIDLWIAYDYMDNNLVSTYYSRNHRKKIIFLGSPPNYFDKIPIPYDTLSYDDEILKKIEAGYPSIYYRNDTILKGQSQVNFQFDTEHYNVLIISLSFIKSDTEYKMVENTDFVFDWINQTLKIINGDIQGAIIQTHWIYREME